MSGATPPVLTEARDDDAPRRRARSRSPAGCCRATCATTSTCSTSCSARSTTSSTTATRRRRSASPPSRPGPPATARRPRARSRVLEDLARPPPAPARRAAPTSAPACATTSGPAAARPRPTSTATATASPGTVGVVMAALLGARGPRGRARPPPPRSAWRCSARTSCATSTRTAPTAASTSPRETVARFGGSLAPGRARARSCATRSPAPTPLYERGVAGIPLLLHGRRAIAAAGGMYREILRQIEREGYGAASRARGRPAPPRKLAVAARRGVLSR